MSGEFNALHVQIASTAQKIGELVAKIDALRGGCPEDAFVAARDRPPAGLNGVG
jgi:hypothetical protein